MKLAALVTMSFLSVPSCEQAQPAGTGPAPTAADLAPAGDCTGNPTPVVTAPDLTRVRVDVGDAPARGDARAPVTIVVFSDFQCPYCARLEGILGELDKRYPGKLRIVFKEHPLPMHDKARLAAKAALAAADQGSFWEMHDAMFSRECTLDRPGLEACARHLRLNLTRFDNALDDPALDARVAADESQGAVLGVTGTPTSFIDGRRLTGAQPVETFAAIIDDELTRTR